MRLYHLETMVYLQDVNVSSVIQTLIKGTNNEFSTLRNIKVIYKELNDKYTNTKSTHSAFLRDISFKTLIAILLTLNSGVCCVFIWRLYMYM